MKKIAGLAFFFILLSGSLYAQTKPEPIEIREHWYGRTLFYDNKKIKTFRKLSNILQSDPAASEIFKKAKRSRTIETSICGAVIASLLGFDIYAINRIENNPSAKININEPYVTFGIVACVMPFSIRCARFTAKAVEVYNEGLHKTGAHGIRPEYYLSFSGKAVGLTVTF